MKYHDRDQHHRLVCLFSAGLGRACCVLLILIVGGCSEDTPEVYDVPKGNEPMVQTPTPQVEGAATSPVADSGIWTVPEGWRFAPGIRQSPASTYYIDDESGPIEVAVTVFPGEVGGLLGNVNRWRGQIGLPPVAEVTSEDLVGTFNHGNFHGYKVHLRGPQIHMLAAGIHEHPTDRTWFVRVNCSADVAERVKDQVFTFAQSFGADRDDVEGGAGEHSDGAAY